MTKGGPYDNTQYGYPGECTDKEYCDKYYPEKI